MIQIYGATLNKKKQLSSALKGLAGLNTFQMINVCNELGIGLDCKVLDVSQYHVLKLLRFLENNEILVESSLKRSNQLAVKRLIDIKSYRGLRVVRKAFFKKLF
jgi:small subunit ribosomal protein S13